MKPIVTMKQIQKYWDLPELTAKKNEDLSIALLSDDFNGKLANQGCTVQNLGKSTLGKFVNGNLRSKHSRSFANADITKRMIDHIRADHLVPYHSELEMPPRTCRESMLCNIRQLVDRTLPAMTGDHPLFTCLALMDESTLNDGEREQFRILQDTIDGLRSDGTPEALTYAIFLLALTSIFRHQMATLPELYDLQAVRETLSATPGTGLPMAANQAPFTDPDYMNDYWLYLFRIGYSRLYSRAHLSMCLDENGMPQAELSLYDTNDSAALSRTPIDRRFTGIPYRSSHDKTVYIVMQDQNDKLGILTFKHQKFNFGPMYFRSGLFLSTSSDSNVPMVQRVAISARKLEQEELPYAEGFLKTSGTGITLTDQQLQAFLKKFQNYPWMEEFERSILPFINSHACKCYRFDEAEILSYSLTELDEQDRLKIMLALKSISETNRRESHTNVNCTPPPDLHKLFR